MIVAVHDYAPFYSGPEGRGMMSEIFKAAGKSVNLDVVIRVLPIKRGIKMLLHNEVDAFSPGQAFMNSEQIKQTTIIPTVFYAVVGFAYYDPKNMKEVVFNSLNDLKGKRLGIIIGSPLIPLIRKHNLTWDEMKDAVTPLRMLESGRLDFAEITLLSLFFMAQNHSDKPGSEFKFYKYINNACSVAFSKDTPRAIMLKKRFEKGMNNIKSNGEYIRIAEDYWGKNNIQKDALPYDLKKYGVEKADFFVFCRYRRTTWGKIIK